MGLAEEHEEGHVFEIMFEDELDWSNMGIELPKGTRGRIRRRVSAQYANADMECDQGGPSTGVVSKKRRRDADVGLEGIVKGQKRGKYILELPDGLGSRHVSPQDLQPLLTQRQAERLLAAVPTMAPSKVSAASSDGAVATPGTSSVG